MAKNSYNRNTNITIRDSSYDIRPYEKELKYISPYLSKNIFVKIHRLVLIIWIVG